MRRGDSYRSLAAAIVALAIKDYWIARKSLAMNPCNDNAIRTRDSVKRFFESDWYRTLCDVNPGIIEMADKEGMTI